jgi:hypothetical protein
VRQFAALDVFDLDAVAHFASEWGFLSYPSFRAPAAPGPLAELQEDWELWFHETIRVRNLLMVLDAVNILRGREDERSRRQFMDILRPRRSDGSVRYNQRSPIALAQFGTALMLLGPEDVHGGGLDALRPARQDLVRLGERLLSHFFGLWGNPYVFVTLSPPPAMKLQPSFNRLGGAIYLSLAEAVAAPTGQYRRCVECHATIPYERRSRKYCDDTCKHRFLRKHPSDGRRPRHHSQQAPTEKDQPVANDQHPSNPR